MDASTVFLIVLLLACPLMMLLMHRGHRGKGSEHPQHGARRQDGEVPLDELREQREAIDAEIARREEEERGVTSVPR